ncbi:MAG: hypothetical protein FJ267_11900, partial [Planctomycetes bacterium]|nr:hypothetical protein [Planctomycetota bacterium]
MIDRVTLVATVLNQIANMLGRLVLSPIGMMPEILGAVVVSVVTGIVLLLAFKYTSNQRSIKRVRSDIKAQLLALSLFKESIAVSLKFQL